MADQKDNRGDQLDKNSRGASGANTGRDQAGKRNPNASGEPDDVAEDRNLSGASTWLTLPDQPADDSDASDASDSSSTKEAKSKSSKDTNDRQSNQ
jgi:hypothetical protein